MKPTVVAVLAALAWFAPLAGASERRTVAELATPTASAVPPIAAQDGRVLWSSFDRALGAWRLMQAVDGGVAPVPVPPRGLPFDVDLGRGPRGAPVAAYSRCRRYDGPAGCDIYMYSFADGRERRLRVSTGADESWPSIWGTHVAFVRSDPDRGLTPAPYRATLASSGRARRLPQPTKARSAGRLSIADLDMRGEDVVYSWRVTRGRTTRSFLQIARANGQLGRLGAGVTSPHALSDPQITSNSVVATLTSGTGVARVVRYRLGSMGCVGGIAQSASEPLRAAAITSDGDTHYALEARAGRLDLVAITGLRHGAPPLSWRRGPEGHGAPPSWWRRGPQRHAGYSPRRSGPPAARVAPRCLFG